ncbi:MAG: zinc ribbon domain-containing protein [Candidatus Lokiarchaeota archaeon]
MSEKIIIRNKGLVRADFNFWVGLYMDKFYDALENRKIIGNKCPKCGDVYVPPRKICGKCNVVIPLEEKWVDLPETGILKNYTLTKYKVSDRRARKSKSLKPIGMVTIDGSNTAIVYPLIDVKPEEIKIGMKVKIKWSNKPKGDPSDIEGFLKV